VDLHQLQFKDKFLGENMEFWGNSSDPLAKTMTELSESSQSSLLGNAGDFFNPVHERDPHTRPKNSHKDEIEFNSAILKLDDSTVMQKFISLKNNIVIGKCVALSENLHIDKEDGSTSVFIQWLQPKGMYELGSANPTFSAAEVQKRAKSEENDTESAPETLVNDTQSSVFKKNKGKGTRKQNTKVQL